MEKKPFTFFLSKLASDAQTDGIAIYSLGFGPTMHCNGTGRMRFIEKVGPEESNIVGHLDLPDFGRRLQCDHLKVYFCIFL